MKTSKLLFTALTLGSVLTIAGYSEGDYGPGFSAPSTYPHPKASTPPPKAAQKKQTDTKSTKKQMKKEQTSSEENKMSHGHGKNWE